MEVSHASQHCLIMSSVVGSSIVAGILYSSLLAIFLIVPLNILPLLVLGNFSTMMTPSSLAIGPTSCLILALISLYSFKCSSLLSSYESPADPLRITKAKGQSPLMSSTCPTTADSTTDGWSLITSSKRPVDKRWPAVLITSSTRVMMCR